MTQASTTPKPGERPIPGSVRALNMLWFRRFVLLLGSTKSTKNAGFISLPQPHQLPFRCAPSDASRYLQLYRCAARARMSHADHVLVFAPRSRGSHLMTRSSQAMPPSPAGALQRNAERTASATSAESLGTEMASAGLRPKISRDRCRPEKYRSLGSGRLEKGCRGSDACQRPLFELRLQRWSWFRRPPAHHAKLKQRQTRDPEIECSARIGAPESEP